MKKEKENEILEKNKKNEETEKKEFEEIIEIFKGTNFSKQEEEQIKWQTLIFGFIFKKPEIFHEQIVNQFTSEDFVGQDFKMMFEAFKNYYKGSKKVDTNLLEANFEEFSNDEGYKYTQLSNKLENAEIVIENFEEYFKRFLICRNALKIKKVVDNFEKYYNSDILNTSSLVSRLKEDIETIEIKKTDNIFVTMKEMSEEKMRFVNEMCEMIDKPVVETGMETFDDIFSSGLEKGHLSIIAARPSMGKSAFALNIALNVATGFSNQHGIKTGKGVLFLSLEMSNLDTCNRIWSNKLNLNMNFVKNLGIREELKTEKPLDLDRVDTMRFFHTDKLFFLDEMEQILPKYVKDNNIELIIIDYLQLIRVSRKNNGFTNRVQEVSQISRTLKTLAKELDVHIIALSQLSRKLEERADKRPMLSDLRESGSIEQDADNVIFLYRANYYRNADEKILHEGKDPIEILVSKQRGGELGSFYMLFEGMYQRFVDAPADFKPEIKYENDA